ncbi:redoxin domain-containing protein [Paenibacillus sp. IB182496]|uniref:Redoxin domain-containing protein n=1 Tax=Paenibacillus sabuli TaxID=2772509 RepID=A0A927BY05_9BACL|nr:redoxin domain-containing protein [Paenibacillus sabuli]MBD2847690.1 redoxin domain-containing protein [Paenibacillus sabuli]
MKRFTGKWRSTAQTALLLLLLGAVAYAVHIHMDATPTPPKIGETAPNVELTLLDGTETALADYRGQGIVLNFWASWCTPCVNELPILNEAYKLSDGTVVVAVNVGEDEETVRKFVQRYDLAFPILLDRDESWMRRYGVSQLPKSFFVDPDGTIVDVYSGEMSEIADVLATMRRLASSVNR